MYYPNVILEQMEYFGNELKICLILQTSINMQVTEDSGKCLQKRRLVER